MLRRLLAAPLHWQILAALVLAIACGQATRLGLGPAQCGFVSLGGLPVVAVYQYLGALFLAGLKMLIVPLIASAVVTAVADLGKGHDLGRLGLRTLAYYGVTTLLAVLTGLAFANLIRPGEIDGAPARALLGLASSPESVQAAVGHRDAGDIAGVFLRMIPDNLVAASADNGRMLAVIFFSLLFGLALARLEGEPARVLRAFWTGVYDIMLRLTGWVMRLAPLGVFGLVAKVSADTAPADFAALLRFFCTVAAGLAVHFFLTLPLLAWLGGGVRPWRMFQAMLPALTAAFSTSSSSATLPVTIECLQERAGVAPRIVNFVTPLGATVNMDGTALYECVAVLFIAQVYGVGLGFGQQLVVVVLALLTSVGVAGVPSASLVAIVVILAALGLPAEALGLLMVFDRILDMMRTSVNVFSDACGATVIARSAGEPAAIAEN